MLSLVRKSNGMGATNNLVRLASIRFSSRQHLLSRKYHKIYRCQTEASKLPLQACNLQFLTPLYAALHTSDTVLQKKRSSKRGRSKPPGGTDDMFVCVECGTPTLEHRTVNSEKMLMWCHNCKREFELWLGPAEEKVTVTPKEMKAFLDTYVIGQETAKVTLTVAVHNHYKRVRHNASLTPPEPQPQVNELYPPVIYPKDRRTNREDVYTVFMQPVDFSSNQPFESLLRHVPSSVSLLKPKSKPRPSMTNETKSPDENSVVIEKTNALLIGPTGSGKTFLAKTIAKKLKVPFIICDCTQFTAAGYVGTDVESIISKLLQEAEGDVSKCEQGIVFLDEVDKLARSGHSLSRDVGGEDVQQGLLKIIEGTKLHVSERKGQQASRDSVCVDTSNILFIASGAFTGLEKFVQKRVNKNSLGFGSPFIDSTDSSAITSDLAVNVGELDTKQIDECFQLVEDQDLIAFGMIPEFVGRLPCVCPFHHLDEEMLLDVLTNTKDCLLKQYQQLFRFDNVELDVTQSACKALAVKAMNKRTGARGLRAEMDRCLTPLMYEIPGTDIKKVTINDDFVFGKAAAHIQHDEPVSSDDVGTTDIDVRNVDLGLTEKQPEITSLRILPGPHSSEEKIF